MNSVYIARPPNHLSAIVTGKIFWSRRHPTGSNSRAKQFIFVNQPQLVDPGCGRTSANIVHLGRVEGNQMSTTNEFNTNTQERISRHSSWVPVLGVALLLVAGFAFFEFTQIQGLSGHLATTQRQVADLKTGAEQNATLQRQSLDELRSAMNVQQTETGVALTQTQQAAQHKAEAIAARIRKEESAHNAVIDAQLNQVKESADQTSSKLDGVRGDVSSVRDDVASAKTDIAKSVGDLQMVRGDMGVMSGLIATNGTEIDMLRKLGDRTISEFTLSRSDGMVKVGDIQLRLVRTVPKHNLYSLLVNADDKIIEKHNKNTNEPVQFYVTSKAHQPYEIVVNEVSKETVKGYLAAPKVQTARK